MVRMHSYLSARYACPLATVTFDAGSQGQLAMVIYEWGDEEYLGKDTSKSGELPVSTRSPSAVCPLNVHYIAEDVCLYFERPEDRSMQQLAARPLHY